MSMWTVGIIVSVIVGAIVGVLSYIMNTYKRMDLI